MILLSTTNSPQAHFSSIKYKDLLDLIFDFGGADPDLCVARINCELTDCSGELCDVLLLVLLLLLWLWL